MTKIKTKKNYFFYNFFQFLGKLGKNKFGIQFKKKLNNDIFKFEQASFT